jgi:hypothetical protein
LQLRKLTEGDRAQGFLAKPVKISYHVILIGVNAF